MANEVAPINSEPIKSGLIIVQFLLFVLSAYPFQDSTIMRVISENGKEEGQIFQANSQFKANWNQFMA